MQAIQSAGVAELRYRRLGKGVSSGRAWASDRSATLGRGAAVSRIGHAVVNDPPLRTTVPAVRVA